MAGVPGFEPGLSVLETDVLTVDTIPLAIANCRFPIANLLMSVSPNRQSATDIGNFLFGLFVSRVLAATAAELAEFQAIRRGFLVLGRHVISTFAIGALKHNVIAWHFVNPP